MKVKGAAICQPKATLNHPPFPEKQVSVTLIDCQWVTPGTLAAEGRRQIRGGCLRQDRFHRFPLETPRKLPFLQPVSAPSGPPVVGELTCRCESPVPHHCVGPGLVSGSRRRTKCLVCHMQRTLSPKCGSGGLSELRCRHRMWAEARSRCEAATCAAQIAGR